jgi:hypothetical protein
VCLDRPQAQPGHWPLQSLANPLSFRGHARLVLHACPVSVPNKLLGMTPPDSTSSPTPPRRLTNPRAADFLLNPTSQRFLDPFLDQENTAARAAQQLGLDIKSVLYRIHQMLELEIVIISRVEPRKGRAIKHYQSKYPSFFVPFGLSTVETIEQLSSDFTEQFQSMFNPNYAKNLEDMATHHDLGVHIWRSPASGGRGWSRDLVPYSEILSGTSHQAPTDWVLRPEYAAIWNQHAVLTLEPAIAKALQRDLAALWQTYAQQQHPHGQAYGLRLGLTHLKQ